MLVLPVFNENPSIMDIRQLRTNVLVPRVSIIEGFYCIALQNNMSYELLFKHEETYISVLIDATFFHIPNTECKILQTFYLIRTMLSCSNDLSSKRNIHCDLDQNHHYDHKCLFIVVSKPIV